MEKTLAEPRRERAQGSLDALARLAKSAHAASADLGGEGVDIHKDVQQAKPRRQVLCRGVSRAQVPPCRPYPLPADNKARETRLDDFAPAGCKCEARSKPRRALFLSSTVGAR